MGAFIRASLILGGAILMGLTLWHRQVAPAAGSCQAILLYSDPQQALHVWSDTGAVTTLGGPFSRDARVITQLTGPRLLVVDGSTMWRGTYGTNGVRPWLTEAEYSFSADGRVYFTQAIPAGPSKLISAAWEGHERHDFGTVGRVSVISPSPTGEHWYLLGHDLSGNLSILYELTPASQTLREIARWEGRWQAATLPMRSSALAVLVEQSYSSRVYDEAAGIRLLETATGVLHEWGGAAAGVQVRLIAVAPDGQSLLVERATETEPPIIRVGLDGDILAAYDVPQQTTLVTRLAAPIDSTDDYFQAVFDTYDPIANQQGQATHLYRFHWDADEWTAVAVTDDVFSVWALDETRLLLVGDAAPISATGSFQIDLTMLDIPTGTLTALPLHIDGFLTEWWSDSYQIFYRDGSTLRRYGLLDGSTTTWEGIVGTVALSPCRDAYLDTGVGTSVRSPSAAPRVVALSDNGRIDSLPFGITNLRWVRLPLLWTSRWRARVVGALILLLVGGMLTVRRVVGADRLPPRHAR